MRAFLAQLRSLRFNANQSRGFTALRLDCGIATNGWWEEAAATSSLLQTCCERGECTPATTFACH